jgi:hypothetical protein
MTPDARLLRRNVPWAIVGLASFAVSLLAVPTAALSWCDEPFMDWSHYIERTRAFGLTCLPWAVGAPMVFIAIPAVISTRCFLVCASVGRSWWLLAVILAWSGLRWLGSSLHPHFTMVFDRRELPQWSQIPVSMLSSFWAFVAILAFGTWLIRRRYSSERSLFLGRINGCCTRCGYDLKEIGAGCCPECGSPRDVPRYG